MSVQTRWLYDPIENYTFQYTYKNCTPGDPAVSGNVNVTEDGWCYGQIKSDPDIAGLGVVITFILTTFFSIFATSVVWWPIAYQRWNTAWEMAKEKLVPFRDAWPRGQIPGQVPKRPQSPAPHAQAQAEESDIEDLSPAENLVIALSDTCHVSGLAVATSSIIKIALTGADYPTYHLFIARCLCFLALTGYYVGQLGSSIYAKLHALHPRRLRVRVFVSALTMLMFITWSFIALPRFSAWEFNEDAVFTPQCFSTHLNTLVPFSFSFWIWANIFWIPQGFVWVLLTPWSFVGRVDVFLGKVDVLLLWVVFKVVLLWTCLLDDVSHSILGAMWICVRLFFTCLATLSTLAGFVLWILFVPTDTIAVPAALLNLVWSTYDVIIAKRSNAGVVVDVLQTPSPPDPGNGEMEFGFGQIFPVVMILLWCVAGIDFASDWYNDIRVKLPRATTIDAATASQSQVGRTDSDLRRRRARN